MLTISELKEEVKHFNSKLNGISKSICMSNSGTGSLDEIPGAGKSSKDTKLIGYIGEPSNSKTMFITPI